MKHCRACDRTKPHTAFGRSHMTRDGYRTYCADCSRIILGGPLPGDTEPTPPTSRFATWATRSAK